MRYGTSKEAANPVRLLNHKNAIAKAIERGINLSQVAEICGVSHQAVSQFVVKHDLLASDKKTKRAVRSHVIKRVFRCKNCGKGVVKNHHKSENYQYCSVECNAVVLRNPKVNGIVEAISMRLNGSKWPSVAKLYGCRTQTVQRAIYQFLHANGLYSRHVMDLIWQSEEG